MTKNHAKIVNPLTQIKFKIHVHNNTKTSCPIRMRTGSFAANKIRIDTTPKTK